MSYKETTNFDAYVDSLVVEFRCPKCDGPLETEPEMLEGGFDVVCGNCGELICCHFRLVMAWGDWASVWTDCSQLTTKF